jgi:predicted dehydrogenase
VAVVQYTFGSHPVAVVQYTFGSHPVAAVQYTFGSHPVAAVQYTFGSHPVAAVQYTFGSHPVAAVQYTFTHKLYTERHKTNNRLKKECGPCPIFTVVTLAFVLKLRKKHGKTSVRVA